MTAKDISHLAKDSAKEFLSDKVPRLSAAVAFYAILAIAPLVIITIYVAGLAYGQEAAQNQLSGTLSQYMPGEAARLIEQTIQNAHASQGSFWAVALSLLLALIGASAIFRVLQGALDKVWEIQPKPRQALGSFILKRLLTFLMVIALGVLLVASLALSTVLATLQEWSAGWLPGAAIVWQVIGYLVSLAVISAIFAILFKVLPDADVTWGDAWVGAIVTGVLFMVGNFLIGLYLGHSSKANAYGAAGSAVVVLLWIYYSAMIFFFGAELTQVYIRRRGREIHPERHAVKADLAVQA